MRIVLFSLSTAVRLYAFFCSECPTYYLGNSIYLHTEHFCFTSKFLTEIFIRLGHFGLLSLFVYFLAYGCMHTRDSYRPPTGYLSSVLYKWFLSETPWRELAQAFRTYVLGMTSGHNALRPKHLIASCPDDA